MIKFEEEAIKEAKKSKFIMNSYDGEFTASDIGLNIKLGRVAFNFPWLEFAKNWHSEEEFQELLDKYSSLNDNYEKEVIKSSILESQIIGLKFQLQQQALPVVPECVGEWIERLKTNDLKPLKNPETYGETGFTEEKLQNIVFWISENQEDYMRAWLDGYQVEKQQLFYLKNKLTGNCLAICLARASSRLYVEVTEKWLTRKEQTSYRLYFTQSEIDSMETGSYELVPVEDGE